MGCMGETFLLTFGASWCAPLSQLPTTLPLMQTFLLCPRCSRSISSMHPLSTLTQPRAGRAPAPLQNTLRPFFICPVPSLALPCPSSQWASLGP